MRQLVVKSESCHSADELLGTEGLAAREYFAAFGQALPAGWEWNSRVYHPAVDEVNALLSFTYGIAKGLIARECRQRGLDAGVGFFHRNGYGSGGLATDLIEPFRHTCCDHQVLMALHHKVLSRKDFEKHSSDCRLSSEGRARYLEFCNRHLIPRMERQLKKLLTVFNAALESPATGPDFRVLLPER